MIHSMSPLFNHCFSDSPFGNPAFRRSINRKSGRNFRRSMRRQERPKIEVKNGTSNGPGSGGDSNSNIAIENVESDIDELSDQMNEMTRRMLRIEEERQVSFMSSGLGRSPLRCYIYQGSTDCLGPNRNGWFLSMDPRYRYMIYRR